VLPSLFSMKKVHIVIHDLFLPELLAAYACADLRVPALEKLLARGYSEPLGIDSLEAWLCGKFGVEGMAIAPLTLLADGVQPGAAYWLRADPVGISMQREQTIMQSNISINMEEATQLCASLNAHFAADGLRFIAPHPQRWYLQLAQSPAMETHALPHVAGAEMHAYLPFGDDALRWHSVLNEIQMLFYEHAVNQAREQRGEAAINGVWLWGGGKHQAELHKPYARVLGDSELAMAFAQAAGLPVLSRIDPTPPSWADEQDDLLLVCERLRGAMQSADIGKWRKAVHLLEKNYAEILLDMLATGEVAQITLDVLSDNASRRFTVTRASLWKIWRKSKPLQYYALT